MRKLLAGLVVIVLILSSGCARKAMILSEPSGARVIVEGKEVCVTPCAYDYKTGRSAASHEVLLEMDGFDPVLYQMKASEVDREARSSLWTAGLMIPGGSLLWVGSLFTNKLKESYRFVLREEQPMMALHESEPRE